MVRRLSYGEHRACRPSQDSLCYGSQHQPINSSQTVGSHDNQTHGSLFGEQKDQIRDQAVLNDALGLNSGERVKLYEPFNLFLGVGANLPTDFLVRVLIAIVTRGTQRVQDVLQQQWSPVVPCQRARVLVSDHGKY